LNDRTGRGEYRGGSIAKNNNSIVGPDESEGRFGLPTSVVYENDDSLSLGGFPYWWYPDYYYGYPHDYASYDNSPVYDYRYWYGLATVVQTELARRGYYHGPIDGLMGSGSREAIRAFQQAQGLPVTGVVDPALLKALKLPAVPRVAASDHGSDLNFG